MLPDLEKILAADQGGGQEVDQAQQDALALKSQADARVREIEARLQEELAQVRRDAQAEILEQAEAQAREIAGATARQIQELTDKYKARQEEAVALLVSRVLRT